MKNKNNPLNNAYYNHDQENYPKSNRTNITKNYNRNSFIKKEDSNREIDIVGKLADDLNMVMVEICVNLSKFVLAGMYNHFLHEKTVVNFFKKNLKLYCDSISENMKKKN
jgi:hypothetical protein